MSTPTMQWQDIRYAPKNGDRFDLWYVSKHEPSGYRVPDCWWSTKHDKFLVFDARSSLDVAPEVYMDSKPTHFMIVEGPE